MDTPAETVIELQDVGITLGGKKILEDLSFSIKKGEIFVIVGYSGTGKSVTLKTLVGLLTPDAGSIRVRGEQVVGMDHHELQEHRRSFGYLFQGAALLNWLSVAENVELPLREHTSLPAKKRAEIVQQKLELVSLGDDGHKYPNEISGGMKKRAALARAIALDPEIILFDEPTSGLDPVMTRQIDELILDTRKRLGITCVVVTHDMNSAYAIADHIAFFHQGKMAFVGTPEECKQSTYAELQYFLSGQQAQTKKDKAFIEV